MNTREKMKAIAEWLAWTDEDVSFGLKSIADAEKLFDYWQERADTLPEFCDCESDDDSVDVAAHRVAAIGYDPLNGSAR